MWFVDAMNVIGSRPDGWWRDRDGAVRRLVHDCAALVGSPDVDAVTVVVDGRPIADLPEAGPGGVVVRYAGSGRDAADRVIAALVAAGPAPATVVTADRALAAQVRAAGAEVVGPRTFRERLGAGRAEP